MLHSLLKTELQSRIWKQHQSLVVIMIKTLTPLEVAYLMGKPIIAIKGVTDLIEHPAVENVFFQNLEKVTTRVNIVKYYLTNDRLEI